MRGEVGLLQSGQVSGTGRKAWSLHGLQSLPSLQRAWSMKPVATDYHPWFNSYPRSYHNLKTISDTGLWVMSDNDSILEMLLIRLLSYLDHTWSKGHEIRGKYDLPRFQRKQVLGLGGKALPPTLNPVLPQLSNAAQPSQPCLTNAEIFLLFIHVLDIY